MLGAAHRMLSAGRVCPSLWTFVHLVYSTNKIHIDSEVSASCCTLTYQALQEETTLPTQEHNSLTDGVSFVL